jgi:tRNA A-37 threonylcarbamoyl transferase component Bud32
LTQYFQEIGAQPSPENLLQKRKTIRSVGFLIRQFHKAGFYHGDLQLKNILVAGDQILLIDFDRSYQKPTLPIQKRMKNLLRLNRSAEKWKRSGLPITRTDRWRFFLAYAGKEKMIREAIERKLRTHSLRLLLHRLGWAIEKILGS